MQIPSAQWKRSGSAATSALAAMIVVIGSGASACQPTPPPGAVVEPMELEGRWLGMRLVAPDSATARDVGVPAQVSGVVVAELVKGSAFRVARAGITAGDVLIAVDGTKVMNLADLYALTKAKDIAPAISVDVLRGGQAMPLVVPAALGTAPTPVAGQPTPMPGQPQSAVQETPLYCPADGLQWMPSQVSPDLRCPRCGGPLMR